MKIKIVTHAGRYHADECMAIALLSFFYDIESIERREPSLDDFYDRSVFVIDIGSQYNPDYSNFDHHQNEKLPASNILVMEYLYQIGKLSTTQKDVLSDLFYEVSNVDRGIVAKSKTSFNSIFNLLTDSFDEGVEYATKVVGKLLNVASRMEETVEVITNSEKINRFFINDSGKFLANWNDVATGIGIIGMVVKSNRNENQWNVISADSEEFIIPEDSNQVFRHNNGFMAVYPNKELALKHVKKFTY